MNHTPNKGLFISVDGIGGSGKTTLTNMLKKRLLSEIADLTKELSEKKGWVFAPEQKEVLVFHPLYSTSEGRRILDEMLARADELGSAGEFEMHTVSKLLDAHGANLKQNIAPQLEKGEVVIAERYITTIASYNVRSSECRALFERRLVKEFMPPHIGLVPYVDGEVAKARTDARDRSTQIDNKPLSFYKDMAARMQDAVINPWTNGLGILNQSITMFLDCSKTPDEVCSEAIRDIRYYLEGKLNA